MINRKLKRRIDLVKAVSALLIFTFSFISVIQIIHNHNTDEVEQVGNQKDNISFTEKCSVCDYLAHKHGKEILLPLPFSISYPLPKANLLNTGTFLANYKFTLQGFTNKGPPISA